MTKYAATTTAEILAARAADQFSGWDWNHDPGGEVVSGPGALSREGWDGYVSERIDEGASPATARAEREYGEAAQSAADAARQLAADAVEEIKLGGYAAALKLARQAASQEKEYGDDPAYAPFVRACEALAGEE